MSEPYSNIPERVAALEAIIPTLATKADLLALEVRLNDKVNSLTRWMIGLVCTVGLGLLGQAVALYVALKP